MEIITGTTDFFIQKDTAVAIGKFDGVHIGHRYLLQAILDQKKQDRKACVFTFDPAPNVFFGGGDEKELTTRDEKRKLFESLGVDIMIEFPLNKETASISPKLFVKEVLKERMNAVFIAAGEDLSFGNNGAGNAELLLEMKEECGLEVEIIQKVKLEGREVSSTLVRNAVENGNLPYAERLLGTPYTISGRVMHGNHMGHSLGMPTLNLIPEKDKLLPPNGVYYSKVLLEEKWYKGISNIGRKPTVEEAHKVIGVETYLYEYDGDAYDKDITVCLLAFRREEQKFAGIEELKQQLQADLIAGEEYE